MRSVFTIKPIKEDFGVGQDDMVGFFKNEKTGDIVLMPMEEYYMMKLEQKKKE